MHEDRKSAAARGYGRAWQKYRLTFLREHPLCQMHLAIGGVVQATVVDHIVPHKGNQSLFWDSKNHQAVCKPCHDRHKQRLEKSGVLVGCDESGLPFDPGHHWNKQ